MTQSDQSIAYISGYNVGELVYAMVDGVRKLCEVVSADYKAGKLTLTDVDTGQQTTVLSVDVEDATPRYFE
ncbi:hypothetical protein [Agrobacterium tumefaciens]|uniref:hypothetical protein n=1 Tax=Agrobacterium tumefaciens TaxID=358 RepID=UPI003B9F1214